jgi:hypothetical protein
MLGRPAVFLAALLVWAASSMSAEAQVSTELWDNRDMIQIYTIPFAIIYAILAVKYPVVTLAATGAFLIITFLPWTILRPKLQSLEVGAYVASAAGFIMCGLAGLAALLRRHLRRETPIQ